MSNVWKVNICESDECIFESFSHPPLGNAERGKDGAMSEWMSNEWMSNTWISTMWMSNMPMSNTWKVNICESAKIVISIIQNCDILVPFFAPIFGAPCASSSSSSIEVFVLCYTDTSRHENEKTIHPTFVHTTNPHSLLHNTNPHSLVQKLHKNYNIIHKVV